MEKGCVGVVCLSVCVMCMCIFQAQVEYSVLNLAYAYATTSGVLRKAAILRHPVACVDREMECAGGVEYQRGRVAIRLLKASLQATIYT